MLNVQYYYNYLLNTIVKRKSHENWNIKINIKRDIQLSYKIRFIDENISKTTVRDNAR
jgi:hypothetical protein